MQKQKYSFKTRLLAFVILVPFTAVSCYMPAASDPGQPPPKRKLGTAIFDGLTESATPVTFYLTDGYEPSETATGKTAFLPKGEGIPENFLITSEELDGGTVVRFLAGDSGMAVSVYFDEGKTFPRGFLFNEETGESHINGFRGTFSDYDEITETFSLTLRYGEEEHTFDGLVLNKNVLTAYQDDTNLTPGQNTRARNYVTVLGVWTALTLQFEEAVAESGETKAMSGICRIGTAVAGLRHSEFTVVSKDVVTRGSAVHAKVESPVAVVVVAPVTVAVSVVGRIADGEESDPPTESPLPPAKLYAPRFELYYLDEAGEKKPVPVIREGNKPKGLSQEFYIRPHDMIFDDYTSNVRFYYTVGMYEISDDIPAITCKFSPQNSFYSESNISSGTAENGDQYFEVKKRNGARSINDLTTTLTIKTYNKTRTADPDKPQYYEYYYVNGEEFTGENGFVIHFIDYVTEAEKAEVLIPEHTVEHNPLQMALAVFPVIPYILPDSYFNDDVLLPVVDAGLIPPLIWVGK
jgi:hypothetical protein